jgi:pimeloyl-ACP methyl ester carboxylesterase
LKLVLLHAFPLDETMWAPQQGAFPDWDVVAPRLYGRGDSLDDWARSMLDELGDEAFVPVGASLGGYLALALARLAPDRVERLVLAGARAGADSPERKQVRDASISLLRERGVEGYRSSAPFPIPDGVTEEELVGALRVLRDRPDASTVVAGFERPLLLVVGEHDDVLPVDEARSIVASAPDGRLEVVEGAGHIVSEDRPERFNEIVRAFLER